MATAMPLPNPTADEAWTLIQSRDAPADGWVNLSFGLSGELAWDRRRTANR